MQTLSFPRFVALEDEPQLTETLDVLDRVGCVLHYVTFRQPEAPDDTSHVLRALEAMERVAAFYEHRAQTLHSAELPIEWFWRIEFDAAKLRGETIGAAQFWGNDDASFKLLGDGAVVGESVSGYKGAFFNPPMGMSLPIPKLGELFDQVNRHLWNDDLSDSTITSWSTDWSNYFDAGHEYWGAFWWTVYSPQTRLLTVIGGSATD